MKQVIIFGMLCLIVTLSGCATASPSNQVIKTNSGNVRVSGDMTMTAISR